MGKSVAFINETGKWGGGEAVLFMLAKGIKSRGWQVDVLLPEVGTLTQRLQNENIHHSLVPGAPRFSTTVLINHRHKIPNLPSLFFNYIAGIIWKNKIHKYLETNRPSIVHTTSLWAHAWGGRAARELGIPCVAHIQDLVKTSSGLGLYQKLFLKWANSIPDQIVCISPLVAKQFSGKGLGITPKIILNAVDTTLFHPSNQTVERKQDNLVIGTVSRMTHWKGHLTCLEAARELKNRAIPFTWHFAGDAILGSEKYYQMLRALVKKWDLSGNIIFEGWIKEMPAFYQKLDVLVHLPIEPEPFGLAIAEAMACGVSVIASTGGGTQKLIEPGGGILVPPGDAILVAQKLEELANRPGERKMRASKARKLALDTFNIEHTLDQWIEVYESMSRSQIP